MSNLNLKKPIPLRVVFILNLFKIFLALGLFFYFSTNNIQLGDVGPQIILYTMFGYIATFAGIVWSILKRNMIALKSILFIDLLISLPARAIAGILIAVISLLLVFLNGKIKAYFPTELETSVS